MEEGYGLSPAQLTPPIIQEHCGLCWERDSKPVETHVPPGEAWSRLEWS